MAPVTPKTVRGSVTVLGLGVSGLVGALLMFCLMQGAFLPQGVHARLLQDQSRVSFTFGPAENEGGRHLQSAVVPGEQAENPLFVTSASGLNVIEYCQPAHAHALAERFHNLSVEIPGWSPCGETKWLDELHKVTPSGSKTFIDIGCNKGYTSAKFFGLWAPEVGFNPKAIHEKRPEVWCGNCADCHEELHPEVAASTGDVVVYCFEPSQANFAELIKTRDLFFRDNKPEVQWFTINKAVSNSSGIAQFSRECTSEQCSLDAKAQHNYDLIDTITVDKFLRKHEIDHVDVLKIDTEGFDATVIQGAMEAISRGSIGVISFEYHEVGVWKEYQLKHVVEWLSGFGYVCYFDGKPTLARLTGCWDDLYEFYAWSNVVCVPRSHPLYPRVEAMTLRHQLFAEHYYQSTATAS